VVEKRFPKRRVVSHVLPVEWKRTPKELADLYRREQFSLILHFGVSGPARGFVIEEVAQNACCTAADACGAPPKHLYVTAKSDPATLPTQLPAVAIVKALSALWIPAKLSDDAGTYLCNAVFYHSLCYRDDAGNSAVSGFVHMPPLYGRDFTHEKALQGGLEIVRVCLGLKS
jgi:pyroglutamyl-peptidase